MTAIQAVQGPAGANGSGALGVDVWASQGSPASVTDWGPVINTLILGGAKRLTFSAHTFPYSTQIDLRNTTGLTFEGESAFTYPTSGASGGPKTQLMWKGGAGTGPAIRTGGTQGTDGLAFRDIGLTYDHTSGFNGYLLQTGIASEVQTAAAAIERCYIGSDPAAGAGYDTTTAYCLLGLRSGVMWRIEKTTFRGCQYAIRGFDTDTVSNPDDETISRCSFESCSVGAIGNVGSNWVIEECLAAYGGFGGVFMPSFLVSDHTVAKSASINPSIVSRRNKHWDFVDSTHKPYNQNQYENWDFTSEGDWFYNFQGTHFTFAGSGAVKIHGFNAGRTLRDDIALPPIDLGTIAKDLVEITGTGFQKGADPATAIAHLDSGHKYMRLGNNGWLPGSIDSVTRERLDYGTIRPSFVYSAGVVHTAITNEQLCGTDLAGMIKFTTSGGAGTKLLAGSIFDITFGQKMYAEGSPQGGRVGYTAKPLVQVWPNNANAVGAWASGTVGYAVVADSQQTGWTFAFLANLTAVGVDLEYGFRVIML